MIPASTSQRLRRKIDLVAPALSIAANAITRHPRLAALLPEYYLTTHALIRASVPLMEAALDRGRALAATDPTAAALAAYLVQHIPEELEHDEWLLDDLAVIGVSRAEALARTPPATVAAIVGAQYYWIFHHHPAALLGYIAVLEGYPPSEAWVAELQTRSGLPAAAFRTLLKHARLDPHHRDNLNAMLDQLPLTPALESLIGLNALQTVEHTSRALREVVDRCERAPRADAVERPRTVSAL